MLSSAAQHPDPDFYPPSIQAAAQEALDVGAILALFETPPSDALGRVMLYSTQRETMLRNPVYPHMLLETLHGLLADRELDVDCRAVLGFTGLEATEVMEAVRTAALDRLSHRFERMEAARDASLPMLAAWRRATPDSSGETELDPEHRKAAEDVYAAVRDLTTFVDQSAVIDVESVARAAGLPLETVTAVVEAFTLTASSDVDDAVERFFRGDDPLRTTPIVVATDGRRMLVHDALALPAVREVVEARLKQANRLAAYERHRGRWVENSALDLLIGVLPGAEVHRSL